MKKLILFLCLLSQICCSQTPRFDSLRHELSILHEKPDSYARDTLLYKSIKAIMNDYVDVNLDSSVHYNTLMIKLCEAPTLQKELIYAYQFAGFLHQIKGDHYKSIQFHYKALLLAEKLKQYTRMAVSHGALAHAYTSLKEYDKATQLCQQGLNVLKKYPDAYIQLSILNVLGSIYREQGKLSAALMTNQELYALAQREHNEWYEAQGLHAIGWVYQELQMKAKALHYYNRAVALARKTGSIDLEGSILLNLSSLYSQYKQWKTALLYCEQAKQTALRVHNSSVVVEAEEKFYKIFKQLGQADNALRAHENFTLLKDSLSKERTEQRIESLQAQYDNVQKENTLQKQQVQLLAQQNQNQQLAQTRNALFSGMAAILLITALLFGNNRRLQTKNREIDRQRLLLEDAQEQLAHINKTLEVKVAERTQELVNSNQELVRKNEEIKAALFKGQTIERKRVAIELHDNLSSLLSAVNMSVQSINPKNLSESEQSIYQTVKALIQNAYSEVRNISHNILPAELEKEGLSQTLRTLIDKLNKTSALRFSLTILALTERLPIEIEFNMYSIVLELINNAIKHAKATQVDITLCRTKSGVDLTVSDNGIGLASSHIKPGVGLQNIQTRLESLGGIFTTQYPDKQGTTIQIKIPVEAKGFDGTINDHKKE